MRIYEDVNVSRHRCYFPSNSYLLTNIQSYFLPFFIICLKTFGCFDELTNVGYATVLGIS